MCNLLLDETPIFASTDDSVREDLKSARAGWLFWSFADDADFRTPTAVDDAPASPIIVPTCGMAVLTQSLHITQKALGY